MSLVSGILKAVGLPHDDVSFVLSRVEIAHMTRGRVRVISRDLRADPGLSRLIEDRLASYREISRFEINPVTGSVIIDYDEGKIVKHSFLDRLIREARAQYTQRKK